jgi:hypothetical protein
VPAHRRRQHRHRHGQASQGAVYNAATKLAAAGTLTQTVEKPATFQLAASSN